jgi:hypothetical protein
MQLLVFDKHTLIDMFHVLLIDCFIVLIVYLGNFLKYKHKEYKILVCNLVG